MKGCSYSAGLKQLGAVYEALDNCLKSPDMDKEDVTPSKQLVDMLTSLSIQVGCASVLPPSVWCASSLCSCPLRPRVPLRAPARFSNHTASSRPPLQDVTPPLPVLFPASGHSTVWMCLSPLYGRRPLCPVHSIPVPSRPRQHTSCSGVHPFLSAPHRGFPPTVRTCLLRDDGGSRQGIKASEIRAAVLQGFLHMQGFMEGVRSMTSLNMTTALELAGSMAKLHTMVARCIRNGGGFCKSGDMLGLSDYLLSLGYVEDISPSLQIAAEAVEDSESDENNSGLKAAFEAFVADSLLIFGSESFN